MLYELINPSDPYTCRADDPKAAMAVALVLGNGKMGLRDQEGEEYATLIMFMKEDALEEHLVHLFGEGGLGGFMEANAPAVADCLDSVMSVGFSERRTFDEAIKAIESDDRRDEYRAKIHDANRSSVNDFASYAWKYAASLRETMSNKQLKGKQ